MKKFDQDRPEHRSGLRFRPVAQADRGRPALDKHFPAPALPGHLRHRALCVLYRTPPRSLLWSREASLSVRIRLEPALASPWLAPTWRPAPESAPLDCPHLQSRAEV